MSKAAGILFVSNNGNALFLRRTESAPDFPGAWDFPGGAQEGATETAEITAIRETREEIGFLPEGKRFIHTRTASPSSYGVGVGSAGPELRPVSPVPPTPAEAAPTLVPAVMPDVDYTTFIQRVTNEFIPDLNSEHDGYAWAPIDSPPEPLHPGCRIALDRLDMNELGVARAIADGRLTSPQKYENIWLFAIRITGTNVAYRPKHEEFVHRDPTLYLNSEFLARCNGLPVIFKHPKEAPILNAEEFSKRIVGTVFLPYVAGDEVWAIVKIWIDEVADLMAKEGLSTSPGVNFANFSVNTKITLDDGKVVLFEGDPSLVDHIAICELGVWDKGGEPAGIRSESREDSMTEAEEKAAADAKAKKDAEEKAAADAKAKKDAEDKEKAENDAAAKKDAGDASVGEKLDKILSHVDSAHTKLDAFGKRLDAVEGKDKERDDAAKKDADEKSAKEKEEAEKAAADKAKKDAEEKEEKERKEREDKAKKDSASLRDEIKRLEGLIPKSLGDPDFHALQDSQARADEIYSLFGKYAPRPQAGDTVQIYERRIVRDLKSHSPRWKDKDVSSAFADDASFGEVRDQVFEDARKDALSPSTAPNGELLPIRRRGESGHTVIEYRGDSRVWMYPFAGPTRQYASGRFDDSSVRNTRR
jgi:8-oxo-dGTP pyrophosphatase MutT (NUDIX family)